MKISHESLSNIPDLTHPTQADAHSTPSKSQTQPDPPTNPNATVPHDPAILDHVLATSLGLSTPSGNVQNASDSLQDMSELQSLKLQQLMDNKSQLEQTLSNIEKKQADTASQILKNLKG